MKQKSSWEIGRWSRYTKSSSRSSRHNNVHHTSSSTAWHRLFQRAVQTCIGRPTKNLDTQKFCMDDLWTLDGRNPHPPNLRLLSCNVIQLKNPNPTVRILDAHVNSMRSRASAANNNYLSLLLFHSVWRTSTWHNNIAWTSYWIKTKFYNKFFWKKPEWWISFVYRIGARALSALSWNEKTKVPRDQGVYHLKFCLHFFQNI